ncbi:hypothetical protein Tco_1324060, partial [Tanacetum coccineum]
KEKHTETLIVKRSLCLNKKSKGLVLDFVAAYEDVDSWKVGSNEEIRRLAQEAERQQLFAQKVQQQNTTFTTDERAKRYNKQAQSQLVRDRDIIRDLEKQRDKLELDVKDYKRQKEEYQKTQKIFNQTQCNKEEKYLDDILQLQAKIKDFENVELSKRIVELEKDLSKFEAKSIAFKIALQHKSRENNSLKTVQKENENFMASLQLENAHLKQTYKDLFESVQRSKVETNQCDEVKVKFDKSLILGKPPSDKHLINSQISKSWFIPKIVVQKDLSKPVTAQSLPKNEKDQFLKRIASLESKLASQDIYSCQKEYHELRTSYNALKVKFDALNRKKWNINVSKSSKPKESVSEKVHTGESSKTSLRRVSQFTTYYLQKDRKLSKKSQSFETFFPQKGFKTSSSNAKNQSFETSHSCFTPVKQVWRQKQSHLKSFKYSKSEMLSMQNKNDSASTINKKGRFSNNAKTNFWNVSSNDKNKWKSSSSTRFKISHETSSFKNQWKIKRNFKSLLVPRELFSNETPVSSSRWNSTSLQRLDTTFNWFSKFGKPVSTVLKWVSKVVV